MGELPHAHVSHHLSSPTFHHAYIPFLGKCISHFTLISHMCAPITLISPILFPCALIPIFLGCKSHSFIFHASSLLHISSSLLPCDIHSSHAHIFIHFTSHMLLISHVPPYYFHSYFTLCSLLFWLHSCASLSSILRLFLIDRGGIFSATSILFLSLSSSLWYLIKEKYSTDYVLVFSDVIINLERLITNIFCVGIKLFNIFNIVFDFYALISCS